MKTIWEQVKLKDLKYKDVLHSLTYLSDKSPKISCILVHKNRILSYGYNHSKSHPKQKMLNYERFNQDEIDSCLHEVHAEFHCLNKLKYKNIKWNKCTLYVYRRANKDNINSTCKPCKACEKLINSLNPKKIIYI